MVMFVYGTLILTPYGNVPIQKLRVGDIVVSSARSTVKITKILRIETAVDNQTMPYCIRSGTIAENTPFLDLYVSNLQRVKKGFEDHPEERERLIELLKEKPKYYRKYLDYRKTELKTANQLTREVAEAYRADTYTRETVVYYQLEVEKKIELYANGLPVETYHSPFKVVEY